jgi:hypothetical protein
MTTLVTVSAALPRWPRAEQILMLDEDTGQHYRLVVVRCSWHLRPYTRVYATDESGGMHSVEGMAEGTPRMVTGGWMDMTAAVADLTQRLIDGNVFTEQESKDMDESLIDADLEAFSRYITPAKRE